MQQLKRKVILFSFYSLIFFPFLIDISNNKVSDEGTARKKRVVIFLCFIPLTHRTRINLCYAHSIELFCYLNKMLLLKRDEPKITELWIISTRADTKIIFCFWKHTSERNNVFTNENPRRQGCVQMEYRHFDIL